MTEKEKMEQGQWYDANNDSHVVALRYQCFDLCKKINDLMPSDLKRYELFKQLFNDLPESLEIVPPFNCDYGFNIRLGKGVFINMYNYFMDCATITIGNNVFIGPHCGFYTATHPLDFTNRNKGIEKALPITIGDNCWFGANVSVMPGVTIGSGCVIGAGSVVNSDIPNNVVVAGIPAKIIKTIDNGGK